MNLKQNNAVAVEVPDEGDVGAGRLLPFIPANGTTTVFLPTLLAKNGIIGTLTARGTSLEGIGIFDGDKLICKKAFSKKEILPNTICIIYIPATGELVAKRVIYRETKITLKSFDSSTGDMFFAPDEIDIRGIVIGFQRLINSRGEFPVPYDDEIPL